MRPSGNNHGVAVAVLSTLCCLTGYRTSAAAKTDTAPDSPFVPAGYVKIFGDEFNGQRLDTTNWWTRYVYGNGMCDHFNDEREVYRENSNHVMTGSSLQLTARQVPVEGPLPTFESGMIRSKQTYKYGYFETRAKMPGAMGVWPAFWLNSAATPDGKTAWPPEIDIFEFVNNGQAEDRIDKLHIGATVHSGPGKTNVWGGAAHYTNTNFKAKGSGGYYYAPFNFPDDFHIFAVLWDTDDSVTWLVDGQKLFTIDYKWVYKDGSDAPFAHVLLNLAVGGAWAARYGIDASSFPQAFDVDYVRVYQKPDHVLTGQDKIGHDLLRE